MPKATGTLSTSHLNQKLDPGEPEIPQGAHVTGTRASRCNHSGMKEEREAGQLHSKQAGRRPPPPPPANRKKGGAGGRFCSQAAKNFHSHTFYNRNKRKQKMWREIVQR